MTVDPNGIYPSQSFLKTKTFKYIFECLRTGQRDKLPPPPIVRDDGQGHYVAIDGHNLLAVMAFRHEPVEVLVADSTDPVLPETSEANIQRNRALQASYGTVLAEREKVRQKGYATFADIVRKYRSIFESEARR